MNNYVILNAVPDPGFCVLEEIEDMDDPLQLRKGVKLEPWPDDVKFHMDPNYPKAIQLGDCINNLPGAIVVSKRLKKLIEAAKPANVEYLPVSIINHKGKVASADYFIVNPYRLQDCIDQKQSVLKWNAIDPDLIVTCKKLIIDEGKVAKGSKIFRLKHFPFPIFVERALAEKIESEEMTGIIFTEIEEL